MTLGQKITNLRKARGMTQEELSESIGVTRQTISKWELDASTPDLDYLCKLCDLFGVTADDLIRPEKAAIEAAEAATTPVSAPAPVSQLESAPRSPSKQITGLRFTGWALFILGLALTQVALLFILFDSDSTALWLFAGIFIIIGLELFLVRWKPLFIVMWTAWSMLTTVISFTTGSPFWFITAHSPTFIEGGAVRLSFTMLFSILWIIYTAFCIGVTVAVVCKHIRAKRAKQ